MQTHNRLYDDVLYAYRVLAPKPTGNTAAHDCSRCPLGKRCKAQGTPQKRMWHRLNANSKVR